jgi:hypothetical protein
MAAATVRSYAVPDSDDEAIADEADLGLLAGQAKKKKVESNLQQWIKHLSILLKEEQKKVSILSCDLCSLTDVFCSSRRKGNAWKSRHRLTRKSVFQR